MEKASHHPIMPYLPNQNSKAGENKMMQRYTEMKVPT